MNKYFKSENELLQSIIESNGDCINAYWCAACPFSDACISKAITHRRLLSKEERVKRAVDRLFFKLVEEELDD